MDAENTTNATEPNPTQNNLGTIRSVTLSEELHQIYVALEKKILTPTLVQEILLRKRQAEQHVRQISFWQIAKEYHHVSEEDVNQLQQIHGHLTIERAVNPHRAQELKFADYLMKNKLAEREQIQGVLRLTHQLDMLGIGTSLGDLLVASKIVAADNIAALMTQFQQQASPAAAPPPEIQFAINKKILVSNKPKNYTPEIMLGLIVIFVITTALWLWNIYQAPIESLTPTHTSSVGAKYPARSPLPNIPIVDAKVPESSLPPEKQWEEEMKNRGLSRWANHWIGIEQMQALSALYTPGTRPEKVAWQWTPPIVSQESQISPGTSAEQWKIQIQGEMSVAQLPHLFPLYIDLYVFDPKVVGPRWRTLIPISSGQMFYATWLSTNPLPKGEYTLKIMIFPSSQTEFLRYFLQLKEPIIQEFPFMIGSPEEIQQQNEQNKAEWKKSCVILDKEYQKIKGWIEKQQRFDKQKWAREKQAVEQKMLEARNTITPCIPATSQNLVAQWQIAETALQKLLADMDQWQQSLDPQYPEFLEQQAEWEIQYAFLIAEIAKQP